MNKRKGLSTKISTTDQSIIKYVYYNYDSSEINTLKFFLKFGTIYKKGNEAGVISLKINPEPNSNHHSA